MPAEPAAEDADAPAAEHVAADGGGPKGLAARPADDRRSADTSGRVGFEATRNAPPLLPCTTTSRRPRSLPPVRTHLAFRTAWPMLGARSFLVAERR